MEITDAKIDSIISKVRKLLAMAEGNANEHEAAVAAMKAQELLEAYNLDMTMIGKKTNTHEPRKKENKEGGLYKWQRNLWYAVSTLNFCRYHYIKGNRAGDVYEHQIIGSHANVVGTEVMAKYLEQAIERIARQWVKENRPGKSIFIKEAIAFREGAAQRITEKLWTARWEHQAAEDAKRKEERARNMAQGINTENALVLQDVINTEEDLNSDYMNGWEPGTSARHRAEREIRQAAAEAAAAGLLRQQDDWDAAHPKEAAERKAREAKQKQADWDSYNSKSRTYRERKPTAEELRRQLGSYSRGYSEGDKVSLHRQVDKEINKSLN